MFPSLRLVAHSDAGFVWGPSLPHRRFVTRPKGEVPPHGISHSPRPTDLRTTEAGSRLDPLAGARADAKMLTWVFGPRNSKPSAQRVDQYVRAAPIETQEMLRKVGAAIQAAASDADESIGYGMAFYHCKGVADIVRRLCYFGLRGPTLGRSIRPRDLAHPAERIAPDPRTKSALRFSLRESIPFRGSGRSSGTPIGVIGSERRRSHG
jgi:hypothetical protein